jgi:hypothetical protein
LKLTIVAFILYRQHHHADILTQFPGISNPDISKKAGQLWSEEPESVKHQWKSLAEVSSLHCFTYKRLTQTYRRRRPVTLTNSPNIAFNLVIKAKTAQDQARRQRQAIVPSVEVEPFQVSV